MPMCRRTPLRVESLEARTTPALIALEPADLPVSTAAGVDGDGDVAMKADGTGFVVAYQSTDGAGDGVFFQQYDANWQLVRGPVAVNTTTADNQQSPSVGVDADGNFVVAWQSYGQDGDTTAQANIYARRFFADGTANDAAEFRVNTTTAGNQTQPDVAVSPGGRFVVVYRSGPNAMSDILAQSYSAVGSGAPVKVGGEVTVNDTTAVTSEQSKPAAAMIGTAGNYVVAYQSFNQDNTTGVNSSVDFGVYARRMTPLGGAAGGEIRVSTVVAGNQQAPDVATDEVGNFTVVWESDGVDSSGLAVVMQRYSAAGAVRGGNVQVNTGMTLKDQFNPHVRAAAGGTLLVTWTGEESDGDEVGTDVYFKTYTAAGATLTADAAVGPGAVSNDVGEGNAVGAIDAAGDFVVLFDRGSGAATDTYLRRYAEAPVVEFASPASAAAESVAARTYTVGRTAAAYVVANVATAVSVARIGGTAAAADFATTFPQTVTIAAGSTSTTATVAVVDDEADEPAEDLVLGLAASPAYTTGTAASLTFTVLDNDPPPALAVDSPAVTEGYYFGAIALTFTISLSAASAFAVTVDYATADGSATAGSDYTGGGSGTVTFAPGETTKTVAVTVTGDNTFEADETVTLTLSNPSNATVSTATGTGTIRNDDTEVTIAVSPGAVAEDGPTPLVFTFTRRGPTAAALSVVFGMYNEAAYGTDYVLGGADSFDPATGYGRVTFAAGSSTAAVTADPTPDGDVEGDEIIGIDVYSTSFYTAGAAYRAVGTITNDDTPPPRASVSDAAVGEGDGGTATVSFTVSLDRPSDRAVTVDYATADGTATAGADYTAVGPTTLTFAPGEVSKTVTVAVRGDARFETDETFTVALSNLSYGTFADDTGAGTITDDDAPASIAVVSGDNQNAVVNTAFGSPLVVEVRNAAGTPVEGVAVAFTTPATGAAAAPATPATTTDATGRASSGTATANGTAGAYAVSADSAAGSAVFALTNRLPTTLTISDASVAEGDSGSKTLTFTVTAGPANTFETVTVDWATADGTAAAGSDYAAASGTLTFAPGETTRTISVTVTGDATNEADETFTVTLSGAVNAVIADAHGVGTVANDDPVPTLAIGDVTHAEGAAATTAFTFTVSLAGASDRAVTVAYATADGTARAGSDYQTASGSLTFQPGDTAQTVTILVNGDGVYEDGQAFTVVLSAPTNATIAAGTGVGTIANDDAAPKLTIGDITVNEAAGFATFTVTRTGATEVPITVAYTTADGSATSAGTTPGRPDFTTTTGTLTFAPSPDPTATQTITVALTDDGVYEVGEAFAVDLSTPAGATIGGGHAVATIADDDPAPTVSIGDVSVNEAAGFATFTVTLTGATAVPIGVTYTTADGTAVAVGSARPGTPDYAPATGTLTFDPSAAGSQTLTFAVPIANDATNEAAETFGVNLAGPTNGATVTRATGTATVTDDDPVPTLSVGDVTRAEGATGATVFSFTVTLSGASDRAVTVGYATADGTALAGSDYASTSGLLTFAPGETTQTVTVLVTGDAVYEAAQTFGLTLSNPTGATITAGTATGTITNDDAAPTLTITDVSVSEADGTATFTVTRVGATELPVAVDFAAADGTATSAGAAPGTPDYAATAGTLTFAPSPDPTATQTFTVAITNDATSEATETFAVDLTAPTNAATITRSRGTATITDDDPVPTLSVGRTSVAEGAAGTAALTFTVTLSAASGRPVGVAYATADGTATVAGGDYTATGGTLVFLPGETTKTVTVFVTGDATFEPDETVLLTLSAPANATLAAATGTGTVTNDDPAPTVSLSITGSPLAEAGGVAAVTATLSNRTTVPVTVSLLFGGTASAADYAASAASIVIPAGSLSGSITLTAVDDTADEAAETVTVAADALANATPAGPRSVTATVADDDLPVAMAAAFTTAEDTPLTIPAPGPAAELVAGPAHGTLVPDPRGGFTYTPAADFTGTDSFQYRVRNAADEVSAAATVTLTVAPVNDTPSFAPGPDQVLPRAAGPQVVPGWATAVRRGPADEAGQALAFRVTTDNPALFDVLPAIDPLTGTLTYTPTRTGFGTATVTVTLTDGGGTANGGTDTSAPRAFTITVNKHATDSRPVDQNEFPVFASGGGGPGTVTVYTGSGAVAYTVTPFAGAAPARAVIADATGDGVADVVAATGPGAPGKVVVIDGVSKQVVRAFEPFGPAFTGGVLLAAGDADGDGVADIAASADTSGGPRVVLYSGRTGKVLADFYGIDEPDFRGGTRVAFGDVNADGRADLIVSAGTGGGPRVAVYDGASLGGGQTPRKLVNDFFAFDPALRDGAFVAAGDLNADGFDDLVFGGGPGGSPRVTAFDGQSLFGAPGGAFVVLANFFAGDPDLRDGVRVAVKDLDGDRRGDLVTAVPTPAGSAVRVVAGQDLGLAGGDESAALDLPPGLLSGVYVG